jgi:hypothetical protein
MTDEIEELALEAALRRRRPTTLPDGFAARLDRVPDEVRPFRSLAVRSVLAVSPWAAVATVAVVLAVAPRLFTSGTMSVGAAPAGGWDPTAPGGGFADVGPFGLPWVPLVPLIAVYASVSAIRRVRAGGPVVPPLPSMFPTRRPWSWRRVCVWVIALALIYGIASTAFEPFKDPLTLGLMAAAPGSVESRDSGGVVFDETGAGLEDGTEYIYRVRPGEAFTSIVTVQNRGRVGPVTILGLPRDPGVTTASLLPGSVSVPTGLGLLRDPGVISDARGDVVPFHPVTLWPGEQITVVVANIAGPCADPTANVPDRGSDSRDPDVTEFVFETFGWRRVGNVFPPFQITVAAKPGCAN